MPGRSFALALVAAALTLVALVAQRGPDTSPGVVVPDGAARPESQALAVGHAPPVAPPRPAAVPTRTAETLAGESGSPPVRDARSARTGVPSGPGRFAVASGNSAVVGTGTVVRFAVEVEVGAGVDAASFARAVEGILFDPRGWIGSDGVAVQRVDDGPVDLRVSLATPSTVDRLCDPLATRGVYSCWNGERAVINLSRWLDGAETYADDLPNYRRYLVNHEVGHGLGHGHAGCPSPGEPAPVMLQQTIDLGGCRPNPWPTRG